MRSTMTACAGSSSSAVPPSTASSALTPSAAPRWLTMSMKGSGNVFSRPTRTPTFFAPTAAPPYRLLREIAPQHVLPVRPIVRPAGPQIELYAHAPFSQQSRHLDAVGDIRVLLSGGDHPGIHRLQRTQVGLVVEAGQEGQQVREV